MKFFCDLRAFFVTMCCQARHCILQNSVFFHTNDFSQKVELIVCGSCFVATEGYI